MILSICLLNFQEIKIGVTKQTYNNTSFTFIKDLYFFMWEIKRRYLISLRWAYLVAQMVKHLPAMRETWVQSLGQEDPLEKEMATHSSILAWKIPWMEEPGRLQNMGLQRVGYDWATSLHFTKSIKWREKHPIDFAVLWRLYNIYWIRHSLLY